MTTYIERVKLAVSNPSEPALIELIREPIEVTEHSIRSKESAVLTLAQLYVNLNTPEKIKSIATNFASALAVFSKPRLAKIIKSLVDFIAQVPRSQKLQIQLSEFLVEWCVQQKRTFLKNRIELKLASLYLDVGEPVKSLHIIDPILTEVRKADDKLLLVELYLLESKINYKIENFAKAKSSLTASRANANNVYCHPLIMADIDMVSGITYAHDQDYKSSYSYFYETMEPMLAAKDPRAILCFKYMILCKIMNNNKEDINQLLNGKWGLKYSNDRHLLAMKALADAHFSSSITQLGLVLKEYKVEIEQDEVVRDHTRKLYGELLEKNLFKIIQSYTRVDIDYIARKLSLTSLEIERKLSEMILDKKITGTLDQSKGCLILYRERPQGELYGSVNLAIDNMLGVVEKLAEASTTLCRAR